MEHTDRRERAGHLTVARFVRERKEAVLQAWLARVRAARHEFELEEPVLINDIPQLLVELSEWLAGPEKPDSSRFASCALGHAMQRLEAGIGLPQFMAEYRLLRETIIEEVLSAESVSQGVAEAFSGAHTASRVVELARLNAGLDVVLSNSVEHFVHMRDRRATADRAAAEELARESEMRYRELFESIDEGFCVVEVRSEGEDAVAYRILQANPAFERQTGLRNADCRRVADLSQGQVEHWLDRCGSVALTGQPARFEHAAGSPGGFYEVYMFRIGEPARRQVAVLLNDITERKRVEEVRQEADRRKDEFLATLSHELRNPMAPIRYAAAMIRADVSPEALERASEMLDRQSQRMTRLLDDLLDMSRITRNVITLQKETLDLRTIVREVVDTATAGANLDRRLTLSLPTQPIWVHGDRARLVQAVDNLFGNAVKYTEAGGRLEVRVETSGDTGVLTVADDGVGLSEDMLPKVFDLFSQAHPDLKVSRGGLGIGLAVVKHLVELHGGRVVAESAGLGRGAAFVITLPVAPAPVPALASIPSVSVDASGVGSRVLVVDDNVDAADCLALLLSAHGFDVKVAYDGHSALALSSQWRPATIVLDIGMPVMDGIEVARQLRATSWGPSVQLIALTGWGQESDRRRTRENGFECHLTKPVETDELLTMIQQRLKWHRAG